MDNLTGIINFLLNMDFHSPTTYFFLAYAAARILVHFVKPTTIAGKIFAWILGAVPPPPTPQAPPMTLNQKPPAISP